MEKSFLVETLEKVTDWTEGKYTADRIFYSKNNLHCVVIKPFVYEIGNRELLTLSEEGFVPENVYLFFDADPLALAKKVRRFVVYQMKHT